MIRVSRRTFSTSLVGLLGVGVLGACGTETDEIEPTVTRVPAENAPPTNTPVATNEVSEGGNANPVPASGSPQASPEGTGGEGEAPPTDAPGPATTVAMGYYDLYFDPVEVTIPANTDVTFTFTNFGALEHAFAIDEPPIASQVIAGGGTTDTLVVNLPPGTYEYYCPVPGHREAGMVGTLTVEEGGSAPPAEQPAEEPAAEGEDAAPPAAGGATTVDMAYHDLYFDPVEVTIPAGTDVTFNFTNQGALEHAFKIDDPLVESAVIGGGATDSLVVNLPAGTYQYHCPVPGHTEAGMVGTLTVQ